jgi:hypothetical protein
MHKLGLPRFVRLDVAIGLLALGVLLGSGIILSAATGGTLVCINNDNGAIRVVRSIGECGNQESFQQWNTGNSATSALSGYEVVNDSCTIPSNPGTAQPPDRVECQIQCMPGKVPLGGGYSADTSVEGLQVQMNHPTSTGWRTVVQWFSEETPPSLIVYAICVAQP